jgi:uncharacterized protein YggE
VRTVSVTGHGEARVVPDAAVVRVVATHRAPGVAEALAGADSAARRIIEVAGRHVGPEQVGTSGLRLWPSHDQEGRSDGFLARHSLTIRCADLTSAGTLLTELAERVGDRLEVEDVSLEATGRAEGEARAREAAYADAVDRGRQLARLAGGELGDPQDVVEGGLGAGPARGKGLVPVSSDVVFAPGETTVTTSVTLTFQLR